MVGLQFLRGSKKCVGKILSDVMASVPISGLQIDLCIIAGILINPRGRIYTYFSSFANLIPLDVIGSRKNQSNPGKYLYI